MVCLLSVRTLITLIRSARADTPLLTAHPSTIFFRDVNHQTSFLYGGWNGNLGSESVSYDEMFILSLPAFRWFRAPYTPWHPRHGHACSTIRERYFLSVGGLDTTQNQPFDRSSLGLHLATLATRDPFPQGLGLFDMTHLNWTDTYDPSVRTYEQSTPVASYYRQK